ncbi:LysE family translocator [Kumtagia ephedrae]|uniref:Lysine transporter LysE n=1 Tax=Kumtagia ephedrae TaxID=2116701 RepID=A0A2P7S255_9HYPH|nr:LysE family translocator [Mesorhizobium ephedrae]PSJ56550.1 lysine transporter LysE [Mesorhizobium ephedrae]
MNPALWAAFCGTVILLQLPPGPDSMLVMARGIGQGRRIALFTVLGMTVGAGMVQLPLVALGVASLVRAYPWMLGLLQSAGALYLVWLGTRLLLSPPPDAAPARPVAKPLAAAREGMIANLVNPWPITFMIAFLPQFVDPARGSVTLQLLLLGVTQKVTGLLVLGSYAIAAGTLGAWIMRRPRVGLWQQRIAGGFVILLGLRMAFSGGSSR